MSGFELWSSDSIIEGNIAYDNDGSGIIIGGKNCVVIANESYNNGVHLPKGAGFGARYKDEDVTRPAQSYRQSGGQQSFSK